MDSLPQSSSESSSANDSQGNEEIAHLKVKLEDIEYKVDRLLERIAQLESGLR